jgi:hypothetical protein
LKQDIIIDRVKAATMKVPLVISELNTNAVIDTGAEVTVLSEAFYVNGLAITLGICSWEHLGIWAVFSVMIFRITDKTSITLHFLPIIPASCKWNPILPWSIIISSADAEVNKVYRKDAKDANDEYSLNILFQEGNVEKMRQNVPENIEEKVVPSQVLKQDIIIDRVKAATMKVLLVLFWSLWLYLSHR